MAGNLEHECTKQNFNIFFILFKIISDLEKIKEEMDKENDFLTELLNFEEAPNFQTARVDQEINPETLSDLPSKKSIGKLEESASARGKLNPHISPSL